MNLRTVLTHSGKALIHLFVVCCACMCEERMRAVKKKVVAIPHMNKDLKDQASYLNVQK